MTDDRNRPTAPLATELRQTGPRQQRSLSLPLSRIVLNPQDFNAESSEVEQNCDPTLPLGLGYYAFDHAIAMARFLSFWVLPSATEAVPVASAPVPAAGWASDGDVRVAVEGDTLAVGLPADGPAHLGTARIRVTLDDALPVLRVAVRSVVGQWALHVEAPGGEPVMVLPGAGTVGQLHLDLRPHFPDGFGGERDLILSVILPGSEVVLDELRFVAAIDPADCGALDHETDWTPGGLAVDAGYAGGRVHGRDVFVDHDSVLRELELDAPFDADRPLTVIGRHVAIPVQDVANGTVTMVAPDWCAVVAIPDGGVIRYYTDESELTGGSEGSPVPLSPVGVWAVPLAAGALRYRIGVGVTPDDPMRAAALAQAAAGADAAERQSHWLAHWDGLLAGVPHPTNFAVQGVDPVDVDPQTVRAEYYRAYAGLYSNVLPPQPETGFAFPTVATGKASMWNFGAPGARSAAAWETFVAIQFLGYADADLAWSCFTGLMSLVDAEGSLAGESLPSRKAQTAWVLYSLTGDRAALGGAYPGLRRLLEWQAEHPRWVYGTYDQPGEQDAEFLSSLIVDLGFGARIATELGLEADRELYLRLRDELRRDFEQHAFAGPNRRAVQHWFPDDPDATMRGGADGFGLQVAMGLAVPGLADWQVRALLDRFDAQFDPADQLAGFDFVKHPNVGYTVAGLLAHDRPEQAQALVNAMLRDVIRSGSFAEVYDRGPGRPRPWGVRPSIFGMTQVIDAVWLNNGLQMDAGTPTPVALPGATGGVAGIRTAGGSLTTTVRNGVATVSTG